MPEETPTDAVAQLSAALDSVFAKADDAPPALASAEPVPLATVSAASDAPAVSGTPPVPVEPPPTAADDLPENLPNEGRSEKWKQYRSGFLATRRELDELKAQHAEFGSTKAERDELKARVAEYEEKVAKLSAIDSISRLENDPDFQAKYDNQRASAVERLKELAGYADIDAAELVNVLSKSGKEKFTALESALEVAPSVLKTKIATLVDDVERIDTERRAEIANAAESLAKRRAEREAADAEQRTALERKADEAFKRTSASLAKELGIDEATITKAREFYDRNSDLEAASRVILKAFAADGALGKASEAQKRIAELEGELAKYREASPGISSGGSSSAPPKELSFIDAILAGAREQHLMR